jgi:hypothetical protein
MPSHSVGCVLLSDLHRVTIENVIQGDFPKDKPLWLDYVFYDIATVMTGAVLSAPPNVKAFTLHEYVATRINGPEYADLREALMDRNAIIVVAISETLNRIILENWK